MTNREASVRVSEAHARRIIDSDHGNDNGIIFCVFAMRMMPVFGLLLSAIMVQLRASVCLLAEERSKLILLSHVLFGFITAIEHETSRIDCRMRDLETAKYNNNKL
ncbi:unnamed protein product [Sphagnum jensenii]